MRFVNMPESYLGRLIKSYLRPTKIIELSAKDTRRPGQHLDTWLIRISRANIISQ